MFTRQKIVAILVLLTFTLQGCNKGVSAVPLSQVPEGGSPYTGDITSSICALQNDVDTDSDGICDNDEETGCADTADCNNDGVEDGDDPSWFSKNAWWVAFGAVILGGGGYLLHRNAHDGKYWFVEPTEAQMQGEQDNMGAGLYFMPSNEQGKIKYKDAKGIEKMFLKGGVLHHVLETESILDGNLMYDAGAIKIKHGGSILTCIHGARLGLQDKANNNVGMSIYFQDRHMQKETKIPEDITREAFFNFCEQSETGIFMATQKKNGENAYFAKGVAVKAYVQQKHYTTASVPSNLTALGYKDGVTMDYQFTAALPAGAINAASTELKYLTQDPNHHGEADYMSKDFKIKGIFNYTDGSGIDSATTSTNVNITGANNQLKFQSLIQQNILTEAIIDMDALNNTF